MSCGFEPQLISLNVNFLKSKENGICPQAPVFQHFELMRTSFNICFLQISDCQNVNDTRKDEVKPDFTVITKQPLI